MRGCHLSKWADLSDTNLVVSTWVLNAEIFVKSGWMCCDLSCVIAKVIVFIVS